MTIGILSDNINRDLCLDRYERQPSWWFAHAGFYFGMLHGGMLEPGSHQLRQINSIVILTDPDFQNGYESGKQTPQAVSDSIFMNMLHQWALTGVTGQALAYELGIIVGTLSRALIPATMLTTLAQ